MTILTVFAGNAFQMSSVGYAPVSIDTSSRGSVVLEEGQSIYYAREGNVFEEFVGITASGTGNLFAYYLYFDASDEDPRIGFDGFTIPGNVALSTSNIVQFMLINDDTLNGAELGDTLYGFSGNDTARGGGGDDRIYGNSGNDAAYGNTGNDVLFGGQGNDNVFGGQGQDAVYGNLENDAVYGNLENDVIFGGSGSDALYGGAGDDQMFGNKDSDTLFGNKGNDTLSGGDGVDYFFFGGEFGNDVITDFDIAGGERIQLASLSLASIDVSGSNTIITASNGMQITLIGITDAAAVDQSIDLL